MKNLTYIILLLVFGTACEMVVDVDVPRDPDKLVLNSLFEVGQPWNVKVHKSTYILDEPSNWAISNATVKIFQGEQFIQNLTYQADFQRYYSESNLPLEDVNYRIEVSAPGFETVWATCKSKLSVPIKSARFINLDINNGGYIYDEIEIRFDDLPGDSFYEISVMRYQPNYYYDEWGQLVYTDSILTSSYISSIDPSLQQDEGDYSKIFSTDFLGDNKEYTLRILVEKWENSSDFHVKLNHVSEEYYKYIRTLNNASWNSDNPFSEPVIVFSNVKNGFGIFAGCNPSIKEIDPKWTNGRNR